MKYIPKIFHESYIRYICQFMRYVCYVAMLAVLLSLILVCMGQVTIVLHRNSGDYESTIISEVDYRQYFGDIEIGSGDEVHIWTNERDEVDIFARVGVALMYTFLMVPEFFAYWLLSKIFSNIEKGKLLIEENASLLWTYGGIQCSVAFLVPYIKVLIAVLSSIVSSNRISVFANPNLLGVLSSVVLMVAAYIIYSGVHSHHEPGDHMLE